MENLKESMTLTNSNLRLTVKQEIVSRPLLGRPENAEVISLVRVECKEEPNYSFALVQKSRSQGGSVSNKLLGIGNSIDSAFMIDFGVSRSKPPKNLDGEEYLNFMLEEERKMEKVPADMEFIVKEMMKSIMFKGFVPDDAIKVPSAKAVLLDVKRPEAEKGLQDRGVYPYLPDFYGQTRIETPPGYVKKMVEAEMKMFPEDLIAAEVAAQDKRVSFMKLDREIFEKVAEAEKLLPKNSVTPTFRAYVAQYIKPIFEVVFSYLDNFPGGGDRHALLDYSVRKGKYTRGGLLMLFGELYGAKPESLLPLAAAIQVSEDFLLVRDDVIDKSNLRRGDVPLQKIYGTELALNIGDKLMLTQTKILNDHLLYKNPIERRLVLNLFYEMLAQTINGQEAEAKFTYISSEKFNRPMNTWRYYRIASAKTAYYSTYGPMQLGAIAAGVHDEATLSTLRAIGHPLGIAYQIADDIIDMTVDEKKIGKQRYNDLYEGKLTLIILNAYQHATKEEQERVEKIYSKSRFSKTDEEIDFLVKLIDKYGSLKYAEKVLNEFIMETKEVLGKYEHLLPDNPYRRIFISSVDELTRRGNWSSKAEK